MGTFGLSSLVSILADSESSPPQRIEVRSSSLEIETKTCFKVYCSEINDHNNQRDPAELLWFRCSATFHSIIPSNGYLCILWNLNFLDRLKGYTLKFRVPRAE